MKHPTNGKGTKGYTFWIKTYYSPHHLGLDLMLSPSPVYAPLDGWISKTGWDIQIGNYIVLKTNDGKYHRFCHLSRIDVGVGGIIEGQQLGITGNTGKMGTVIYSNHLHWDIWHSYPNVSLVKQTWDKNLLIDPEIYFISKEDIVLKDRRSFQFGTESIYGRFSDTGEWDAATGKSAPWQMINKKAIKFKDNPEVFVSISSMDSYRELLGDLEIIERDLVPRSDLDVAEAKIKTLQDKLAAGQEETKKKLLERITNWFNEQWEKIFPKKE